MITDVKSQLEHQIQETKESGWIFDKINSMKNKFFKTGELNGTSYIKIPLGSNALINTNRVSNYTQYFNELSINDFTWF